MTPSPAKMRRRVKSGIGGDPAEGLEYRNIKENQ
jgi:hypothetical protein